jgi:hypothetical protein
MLVAVCRSQYQHSVAYTLEHPPTLCHVKRRCDTQPAACVSVTTVTNDSSCDTCVPIGQLQSINSAQKELHTDGVADKECKDNTGVFRDC